MNIKALSIGFLMLAGFSAFAQETEQKEEPFKKYGFKSAIATISTNMMGQKIESTAYIDEYGALECQKTKMSVPGMGDIETATIGKDGKAWVVNYTMKQIQETSVEEGSQPNFLNLTDEMKEKFKIEEAGKETLLDRECTKYTMEVEAQGMKAKVTSWVYKGLALKSETELGGVKITAEVTDLQEDAMILPQIFDVPKF